MDRREFLSGCTAAGLAATGIGTGTALFASESRADTTQPLGSPSTQGGAQNLPAEQRAAGKAAASGPFACWLESSLKRIYPRTPAVNRRAMTIPAGRGERLSFQIAVRNSTAEQKDVEAEITSADGFDITIRRVGYVPFPHFNTGTEPADLEGMDCLPGYVPDPLFPGSKLLVGAFETQSFWVTARVPKEISPGPRKLDVKVRPGKDNTQDLQLTLDVRSLVVGPRKDFPARTGGFPSALRPGTRPVFLRRSTGRCSKLTRET